MDLRPKIAAVVLLICFVVSAAANTVNYTAEKSANMPLRWQTNKIQIAFSSSLLKQIPNIKSDTDVAGALRRSMKVWEQAADIEFVEIASDKQNVSPAGKSGDGVSLITIAPSPENILMFVKDPEEVAAATRVFFDRKGFITEADIVLNPYQQFSSDGTFGTFDLESTLTHEIGHLLGLDHSALLSASMHENYGKNGLYGFQNFMSRTLAENDLALIRAKYGDREERSACCGAVSGKLTDASGKAAKNVEIWAEQLATGKVYNQTVTNVSGGYRFDGLPAGIYKLFAQSPLRPKNLITSQEIGEIEVVSGETLNLPKKLSNRSTTIELRHIGFNGQFAGLAVPLNAGKVYTIYLAGIGLDPKKLLVGFNSPFLSLVPATTVSHDYGNDLSVLSVEVRVDPQTPAGEYSVFAESAKGVRSYVVGGIKVDSSLNPLSDFSVDNN